MGFETSGAAEHARASRTEIPQYLQRVYWWAYVDPRAVYVFERQWLVNLILWGNFGRLRDAAVKLLEPGLAGRTLQIACVYGDLTARLADAMPAGGALDVLDVLPVQLDNLRRKLGDRSHVGLIHSNSAHTGIEDGSYDQALLFFLLHEQPEDMRRATLAEAVRVVRPGGRVVIVDYHRPSRRHPLRWIVEAILRRLEPFAMDLWRQPVADWLPQASMPAVQTHRLAFGDLYQIIELRVPQQPDGRTE